MQGGPSNQWSEKMKILVKLLASSIVLATLSSPAAARTVCAVVDPTGTPLNVRSSPNGGILGALHNDTLVIIKDIVMFGGQKWALVLPDAGKQGWVVREYLDCF
jgi:hypothetical protein